MTVPTPTDEYTDLNSSPFTPMGGVQPADSQHAVDVAIDCDGVDDYSSSSETPIAASSGSSHSMAIWIKTNTDGSASIALMGQADTGDYTDAVFYLLFGAGPTEKLEASFFSNGLTDYATSTSTDVLATLGDGQWRLVHVTVNGNDINLYIDGVEVSYTSQDQVTGGGFTGVKAGSITSLSVGAADNATEPFDGAIAPPRFWEGTTLTDAQVLEDFNEQYASVFVPTPDFEDNDLSDGWTVTATVTYPIDQHGGSAAQSGGVTGFISQGGVITDADGQGHTYSAFVRSGDLTAESDASTILNQRQNVSNAAFSTFLKGGNASVHGQASFRNQRFSNQNELFITTSSRFDDDEWVYLTFVADTTLQDGNNIENSLRVYANSVRDVTGSVVKVGLGDQGPIGLAPLEILMVEGLIAANTFQVSRPKIWRTDVLSQAQQAKLYQQEVLAARNEGDLVAGLVLLDSSGAFGSVVL